MTGAATVRTPRTVEQERRIRQRELAVTLRIFARAGFDEGSGGHVTARDPQDPDRFWINPFGVHFAHVRVRDLLCVDLDGTVVAGTGRVNPAGYAIHSALHAARPDVVSVAHVHSVHGRAWATLGLPLDPITQDSCAFYGDHAVYTEFNGVVLDPDEGRAIARTLGGAKAVILQNHGLLTVGASVGEAAWWFISLDRSCQIQLLAQAAGRPISLDSDTARASADIMGTPGMGRLNFRPMYEHAVRLEPDALD
jgi:ribulose-5-phosphate 4-epimerase/fuculose-1-phosphate aldolase